MTPLRRRMLEDMGIRNLAANTQLCYVKQVAAFARYFDRSPDQLGPEEVRIYQNHLVANKHLTASSVVTATAALRFLYRVTLRQDWTPEDIPMPKKPSKLPVVLSPEEVSLFLASVLNLKHRTILMTTYAAGLRVSEVTHLRVTDVDSQRMVIRVDQGKGNKDRYVMLSPRLLEALRSYWTVARPKPWLALAISGRHPWAANHAGRCPGSLPQGAPSVRGLQADHPALAAPCVRNAPAGVGHRRAHDSVAAGPSRPGHHLALPEDRHLHRVRHRQPAGPAAQERTGAQPSLRTRRCALAGWRWRTSFARSALPFAPNTPLRSAPGSAG